mgnify:CR=1 FL=1
MSDILQQCRREREVCRQKGVSFHGTCSKVGLDLPICCKSSGNSVGFCCSKVLMCWNWGWFLKNASVSSPEFIKCYRLYNSRIVIQMFKLYQNTLQDLTRGSITLNYKTCVQCKLVILQNSHRNQNHWRYINMKQKITTVHVNQWGWWGTSSKQKVHW